MNKKVVNFPNKLAPDVVTHYKALVVYQLDLQRALDDAIRRENPFLVGSISNKLDLVNRILEKTKTQLDYYYEQEVNLDRRNAEAKRKAKLAVDNFLRPVHDDIRNSDTH